MYDGKNAAMKIFIGQKRTKKPMIRFWRLRLGGHCCKPIGHPESPVLPPVSVEVRVSGGKGRASINQSLYSLMIANLKHLPF